ncbi:alpha/beta fold hydrolase [Nocardioides jishulii]|uniref:Alpha/beta fold hydrolase n=1 Tax=Nocardioides jishulii TaxID=2575440 RepID=A0A4U2YSW5_9ACTN|nr:alpha/beta fold hydrolase [Nocardioides jishulii]QCX28530.1 alpha/beta fold hydrolase [Nocardioides jishulii]TKI64577.1 alpha/beta fold hydrolase [Nocardioides jishulii]
MKSFVRDGLSFDVTTGGPVDGRPVVLLHGFPQRATAWREVEPVLHAAGLRTYAPDQRGYSPHARPKGRWNYRMRDLVGDVVALVEEIGEPVHLVCHDWGAIVGWGLTTSRPDLVRTLTAVSVPHPGAMARATMTSTQALRSWYFALFNVPFLVDGIVNARPHVLDGWLRGSGMTDEQLERFHREIVADGALSGALAWYRALPLSLLPSGRPSGSRQVTVPTTYVWSTGDSAISRAAAEACDEFVEADYRYVELDGVSHWIPEEVPAVLAEIILERVDGAHE